MKKIFLDSASTTYCDKEVVDSMLSCFSEYYGNPSSTHTFGREATKMVSDARSIIAKSINATSPNEIYFTSSGTEANNMALFGIARANKGKGKHIISTKIEHQSVIDSLKRLEEEGFEITYLQTDKNGQVSIQEFKESIRNDTILISIMLCNNEVGTITNIKELAKISNENGIIFHTDAVAGYCTIDIDVKDLNIDAMSLSSQKIYGPKGSGCLYIRNGIKFESLIYGGNQEGGKRAGTLNVPSIVGFGKAVELYEKNKTKYRKRLNEIKTLFWEKLSNSKIVTKNGVNTVDTIISLTFKGISNELIQTILDMKGICCSLGSACTAGSTEPSHVLLGMGYSVKDAKSTIRFSFCKDLIDEDIILATETILKTLEYLG
ncbi:MAG: cysteine desulfurase [Clostridia bacterium]|nr:cysteine desulfurase [Clostridia bacterium]